MKFSDMMALHDRGPDSFIGRGPRYPWGGLYGGQIVAQSLRAAAATVAPEYRVHSLHAYFIRRGDAEEPIRFEVDRLRNGRSFVTRAVVARESMGAILHMSASFQSRDAARYVQASPVPEAPDPETLEKSSWTSMFDRRWIHEEGGRAQAWLRIPEAPAHDPVLGACALAYLSDDLATDAVRSQQQCADGVTGRQWNGISLDHAIWFHHPLVGNDWQLHDFRCEGLGTPHGLAMARSSHPRATIWPPWPRRPSSGRLGPKPRVGRMDLERAFADHRLGQGIRGAGRARLGCAGTRVEPFATLDRFDGRPLQGI